MPSIYSTALIRSFGLLLSLLLSNQLIADEKHALIIAIGNYPEAGGWSQISSLNDVPHVLGTLNYLGFKDDNIVTVLDDQATKKNIVLAFSSLAMEVSEGDVVYIHFSGHGQQAADDNGDELDGLDECIVPYDSPLVYTKGVNEGEKLIRDDLLNSLTKELRKKCGSKGQVVLILDSCHSGTGFRGRARTRGTDKLMAPKTFRMSDVKANTNQYLDSEDGGDLAPIIGFFGSSAKELNFETVDQQNKPVGSLTYSLSQVIGGLTQGVSIDQLFSLVKLRMKKLAPRQHPQIEGPLAIQFLNSTISNKPEYYQVSSFISDTQLTASCGTLHGIHKGSRVSLINAQTGEIITKGTISVAYLNEAQIVFEKAIDKKEEIIYGVLIDQYAMAPITIGLENLTSPSAEWVEVFQRLSDLSFLVENQVNPDLYLVENKEGGLSLGSKYADQLVSTSMKDSKEETFQKLKQAMINQVQSDFLRSFYSRNPRLDLVMELISVDPDTEEELAIINPDQAFLKTGQCIKFKISNYGISGAYVSLLDIQPDNKVNVILPAIALGYKPEEYFIGPGESLITNFIVEIAEPLGDETLLLIGSREPQDLSGILMTQGRTKRGINEMDSFEHLLNSTFGQLNSRGAKLRNKKKNKLSTKSYQLTISNSQ